MTPYIDNGTYDDLARDMHHSQRKKDTCTRKGGTLPGPRTHLRRGPRQLHASRDVTDARDSETPPSLKRQTLAGQTPQAASAS